MKTHAIDRRIRVPSLSRITTAAFATLLPAGIFLQFFRLDAQGFWLDELWTAVASNPDLPLHRWMQEWVIPDVHPPLYLFLARQWQAMTGGGELNLRLLSTLFSLGLIVSIPLFQRWNPVTRQPWALAGWFACSVGTVVYAREARAYALLLLLTAVVTLLSTGIARHMEQGKSIGRPLLLLVLVVIIAEYSHYFGALAGAGAFGALCLFALWRCRQYLYSLTLSGIIALGVLIPWLIFHVLELEGRLGGNFWIQNNWSMTFPRAMTYAAGSPAVFPVIAAGVAVILLTHRHRLRWPACFVPLTMSMIMVAAALLISLHTPVITDRNLLVLLPPFYLLTITAFDSLLEERSNRLRTMGILAPLFIVSFSFGSAVNHVITEKKDDWRGAAEYIASLPGCRDAVLPVNFWPAEIYAYYLPVPYRQNLMPVSVQTPDTAPRYLSEATFTECPLLLWSGHMTHEGVIQKAVTQLGMTRQEIVIHRLKGHLLILDEARLRK